MPIRIQLFACWQRAGPSQSCPADNSNAMFNKARTLSGTISMHVTSKFPLLQWRLRYIYQITKGYPGIPHGRGAPTPRAQQDNCLIHILIAMGDASNMVLPCQFYNQRSIIIMFDCMHRAVLQFLVAAILHDANLLKPPTLTWPHVLQIWHTLGSFTTMFLELR